MEPVQKDRITRNIYQLVMNTTCNDALITAVSGEGVINERDVENLKSQDNGNGKTEKSLLFYNMILSSKSKKTYGALVRGLELTEQKEASKLLKDETKDDASVNGKTKALAGGMSGCTIDAVVEEMTHCTIGNFLVRNWTKLAIKLCTPGFELEVLRQDLVYGKKTHPEVIADVLEIWQNENGDQASINALIEVAKDLGWFYMAECLHQKFVQSNHVSSVEENLGKLAVERS